MGNTGLILGIGALVIGGWCFIAGPCKEAVKLTKGMHSMTNDPRFKKLVKDHKEGRITDAQMKVRAEALGIEYAKKLRANYAASSYYGGMYGSGYRY